MSPLERLWDSVAAPYKARDLHECVRLTRLQVDEHPHDLGPRFLLAALYRAMDQPGLALLQYERLLPLAVGRGELFLALAAQRRLDELSSSARLHARRYHAMHQWFASLARGQRRRRGEAGAREFGPHVLMRLPVHEFAAAAELCAVESLASEPRELQAEAGLLWVVLHGRVRWSAVREGAAAPERTAGPGDLIVLAQGEGERLRIEADTPAECLRLPPELLTQAAEDRSPSVPAVDAAVEEQVADLVAAAGGTAPQDADAAGGSDAAPDAQAHGSHAAADEPATADAVLAHDAPQPDAAAAAHEAPAAGHDGAEGAEAAHRAPAAAHDDTAGAEPAREAPVHQPPATRPRRHAAAPVVRSSPRRAGPAPDPLAEPTLAVGAPLEKRRETRLSVSVANRVVLMGLADTRVAPLPGALLELTADGMRARFRSGDLRQARQRLVGSLVGVHLTLPGTAGALRTTARVVEAAAAPGGDPEGEMRVGLEFLALVPALRDRLERLVAEAA